MLRKSAVEEVGSWGMAENCRRVVFKRHRLDQQATTKIGLATRDVRLSSTLRHRLLLFIKCVPTFEAIIQDIDWKTACAVRSVNTSVSTR